MTPANRDYLIEVAMDAYAEASGQSVSRPWMEAAFNTIAAHIWDEGYEGGRFDGECMSYTLPEDRPYRASEAK